MIDIKRKADCCGCGACYDVCTKQAILWVADEEGFFYPRVDATKCVNCGLCNKVCPVENSDAINAVNAGTTPTVLAAYNKDGRIRMASTSGGVFWGLAEAWVKDGGYVAGAVFYDHFKIKHIITNDLNELQRIRGSKYAQSDTCGIFKEIKRLLQAGEKVLATGLPCQMAGLRRYLQKDYDNLLIVDLICHSVTSQWPFQQYLNHLEKKYGSTITHFYPKNKEKGGWHRFAFKATFENGETYLEHAGQDYYCIISYGTNILSRPSCFECHYKHVPQPSDITIGDFWGIEKIDSSWDSPHGVSKIMLNTNKGRKYFEKLNCFETKEFDIETAIYNNPRSWTMIKPINPVDMEKRKAFVRDLHKHDLDYCMKKYLIKKPNLIQRIKHKIRIICRKF